MAKGSDLMKANSRKDSSSGFGKSGTSWGDVLEAIKARADLDNQEKTKARLIENMNEKQLDDEIEKLENLIDRFEKVKGMGSSVSTKYGDVGGHRESQRAAFGKRADRDARKAEKYVEAQRSVESFKGQLKKLEAAKKAVSGTGKTLAEIRKNKIKNGTVKNKWTVDKNAPSIFPPGYKPQITRKSGAYTIHSYEGGHSLYKNGESLGLFHSLKEAQMYAERKG